MVTTRPPKTIVKPTALSLKFLSRKTDIPC